MRDGVTIIDPLRIDVRGNLSCGRDVIIDVNCVFEGDVVLGDRVSVGANAVITNCQVGNDTQIHPNCVIDSSQLGARCQIGPFARLRPDARLADQVKVGNFVEIKKSDLGFGSKVNHLTYVGDSSVGERANLGAGTITCNYDGANKHRTLIGDDAFIGSGVQLVAPVRIGAGATIGAGSVITRDTPDGQLTLSRAQQKTIDGWRRPTRTTSK